MSINKNGVWKQNCFYETTLPEEYCQLEYIQSDGTQYIDTGVYTTNKIDMDIIMMPTYSQSSNTFPFSSRPDSSVPNINTFYHDNTINFEIGPRLNNDGCFKCLSLSAPTFQKMEIKLKNNIVYLNEEIKGNYSSYLFSSSTTLLFFATRSGNVVDRRKFIGRFYKCKIWNNNIIIRDFIPCYRKSDNIIGLYDIINNIFYVNQGTGNFITGPEIIKEKNKVKIYKETNIIEANSFIEL